MCQVAKASFGILVLAAPPGKDVPAKCCKVSAPVSSACPIIGFVFFSAIGQNVCDLSHCCKGNEIETCLRQSYFAIRTRIDGLANNSGWIDDIQGCVFTMALVPVIMPRRKRMTLFVGI